MRRSSRCDALAPTPIAKLADDPLWLEPPKPEEVESRPELQQERACYVCKKPFVTVHRYYDSMCEACGDFNYAKREQTANLAGHYALVTP